MKAFQRILSLLLLTLVTLGCSNDDDNNNSNVQFSPELLNGTWRISFFSDENEERTAEFNGYEFFFNVEAETATITYNGTTKATTIELFIENELGDNAWVLYTDFDNIDTLGNADLNDLVEDWIVVKVNSNATVIEFEELYSNNTPEILHFTKVLN